MKRSIFLLIIITSFSYSQNKKYELNDDFDSKNFLKKPTPDQPIKPVLSPPNSLNKIANSNPEFISVASDSAYEDSAYIFNVLTNDPDGNSVTITATGKPTWTTLSEISGGKISDVTKAYGTNSPDNNIKATESLIGAGRSVAFDSNGNSYYSDMNYNVINKIDGDGIQTIFAGTGAAGNSGDGGTATAATFDNPSGIAFDSNDNLYIADFAAHVIRKVGTNGIISTFAGTGTSGYSGDGAAATSARLNSPNDVAFDSNGNLYIADQNNACIRKVDANGNISTYAGTCNTPGYSGDGGAATSAEIDKPSHIIFDSNDNLYISDFSANSVRKVDANGNISTFAGSDSPGFSGDGGAATSAELKNPQGVAVDASGNVYINDYDNYRIRIVDTNGNISTFAGNGSSSNTGDNGNATSAGIYEAYDILYRNNSLYIPTEKSLRKIDINTGIITTIAGAEIFNGDGIQAIKARISLPRNIWMDKNNNLFVADQTANRIRKIDINTGIITTVTGTGVSGFSGDSGPATSAQINDPRGVTGDNAGNLYISDRGNSRVRKIDSNGNISTIAGTGTYGYSGDGGAGTSAKINFPYALTIYGGDLYFAEISNHIIRKLDIDGDGTISTVAGTGTSGYSGDGGAATSAKFYNPGGVNFDSQGNMYIADTYNHRIRKVDTNGNITTVAGTGTAGYSGDGDAATSAKLNYPINVIVDAADNLLIADWGKATIRKVWKGTGIITTVAGNNTEGYTTDKSATDAEIKWPQGMALDSKGNLFFGEHGNNMIRKVDASYYTLAGTPKNSDVGTTTMTLTATDGQGGSTTQSFALKVINTNDPPVLTSITNVTTNEDTAKTVTLSATDVDGDALTYTGKSNTDKVTISISSNKMTLTPAADWYGNASITAYVSDGTVNDSTSFTLTVASISDVAAINTTTIEEDASATVTLSSTFSGTSTYSAKSDTSAITVSVSSTTLQLTPSSNWNGSSTITAYASVGTLKDSTTFTLTVTPVNDAPVMTISQNTSLNFDGTDDYVDLGKVSSTNFTKADFSIQAWVKTTSTKAQSILVKGDGDGAWEAGEKALYIENAGYPWFVGYDNEYIPGTGLKVNDGFWHHIVATWDYSQGEDGIAAIYVDSVKATVGTSYRARTADNSTDRLYLGKAEAGEAKNYFDGNIDGVGVWNKALASDEVAALYNAGKGINATYNSGNYSSSGNLLGYWSIDEGSGTSINDISGKNTAGTISGASWKTDSGVSSENFVTDEEKSTKIKLSAIDIDSDALTYTATADTNALTLSVLTDTLLVTPGLNYTGTSVITVIVSDNALTDTAKFDLKVININDAPVMTAVANDTTSEDSDGKVLKLSASDVDGDTLTYLAFSDTLGLTVSVSNDTIKLKPAPDYFGTSKVTTVVSDGAINDSTTFSFTVLNVQDKPYPFEWVSTPSDTIYITQDNITSNYILEWTESKEVDNEVVDYLLFAQVGVYGKEEILDTISTKYPIPYSDILEGVFENQPTNAATVRFSIKATDGIDTVDVTGDDRVLYVNRYQYLSTLSEGLPTEYALHENYPNPFNPTTTLRFDIPEVSDMTLIIYNMLGQKVRTFQFNNISAGYHTLQWNARNDYGDPVSTGLYIYQMQSKEFIQTRKMIFLK